jgi:hypothetical protein
MLNNIEKLRKIRGGSSIKPKPILRIGVGEHVAARREIFKNLMSFSVNPAGHAVTRLKIFKNLMSLDIFGICRQAWMENLREGGLANEAEQKACGRFCFDFDGCGFCQPPFCGKSGC